MVRPICGRPGNGSISIGLKYLPTEYYSFGLPDGYAPGEVEAFTPFSLDKASDAVTYPLLFGCKLSDKQAAFQYKLRDLADGDYVIVHLNGYEIVPDRVEFRPCQPPNEPAFVIPAPNDSD